VSFIVVASGLATIIISLAPALFASREDAAEALRLGTGSRPRQASFSRRALVAVQVAASFTLLVGGGMVLKGMQQLQTVDPGFDPERQLVARVDLVLQNYSEAEGRLFHRRLRENLIGRPEIEAVGLAFNIPLSLSMQTHGIEPEGYEIPEGERLLVDVNTVGEGYFEAMGISFIEGRPFNASDTPDTHPVVIVNEAFRDRFWPGESPLGKRVLRGDAWFDVVGMVPTGKYFGLGEDPKPYMYYAFGQHYEGMTNIHIRTAGDPLLMVDTVRREIGALDPTLPVQELNAMTGRIDFALMPFRIATGAMWTFGLIAVLLSSIGLYGLVAYFVNRQKREIGIRIALGAVRGDVLRHVIGRGMRLTVTGLAIGFIFALGAASLASTAIRGLRVFDPVLLGIPMILLGAIAFVASLFPALLAARIAPAETLRVE
jgi:predicted permease